MEAQRASASAPVTRGSRADDRETGALVQAVGARFRRADGGDGGGHDVPDHGLHRLRQSADSLRGRHAVRRRVRRDLSRGGVRHSGDGAVRQLPDRAGSGDGAERLLHVRRRARNGLRVAGRARGRVRLRRAVRHVEPAAGAALDHRCDPAGAEAGDLGRHRPLPRGHRATERRHHRGKPGDARHRGRTDGAGGRACPARLLRDRSAIGAA